MISHAVIIEGLTDHADLDLVDVRRAAHQAINKTLDRARAHAAREIRNQVAFPYGYLEGADSRLRVTQRATSDRLEGIVTGRQRPTSLARFVTMGAVGKRGGVRLTIKPGSSVSLPRAFLMPLRAGSEPGRNLGLAMRVPKGTKPDRAYKPTRIADGLYLLYGASVDQVFRTVREDISAETAAYLEAEFSRLLELGK